MKRVLFFLLIGSNILFADTFVHKETKETLIGYPTDIKKHEKTLIRTGTKFTAKYINCKDYEIKYSLEGRRNKVIVVYLGGDFNSQSIINAFKERLDLQANQGPFLIILEIGKTEWGMFNSDIARKIQEIKNAKIVAIVKEESQASDKIINSCSKAYHLKDFKKISDVHSQIAKDFLLEKFLVIRDRYIAGVQKDYLSAKEKVSFSNKEIETYLKNINASEKNLAELFSRYRKACRWVHFYKNASLDLSGSRYYWEWYRKYSKAKKDVKRLRTECDNTIKNIIGVSKKVVSTSKSTLFYAKKYPEFKADINAMNNAINRANDAYKKASDVYDTLH